MSITPLAFKKGFTLVELLVVIAIIGIFSAVALATYYVPRDKSSDNAIKADLKTIISQAQLFADGNTGKFNTDGVLVPAGTCPTIGGSMFAAEPKIKLAIASINTASGDVTTCYMNAAGTNYVIWAPLKTSGYLCIDETNIIRPKGTQQGANTTCQ